MKSRTDIHYSIYVLGLMMVVISLPLSHFLMGLSTFVLFLNWVAEWDWKEKWQRICNQKVGFVFGALYLFLFLGLIRNQNWPDAGRELLAQLPLIFMPVLLTTSRPLTRKATRFIFHSFIYSTLFCCLCSWIFWAVNNVTEMRDISLFVDHIRFSLCVVLAFVFSSSYMIHSDPSSKGRLYYGLTALLLFVYIIFSHTLTGVVCLFTIVICYAVWKLITSPWKQKLQSAIILFVIFFFGAYLVWMTATFFVNKDKTITVTETAYGNPYTFDANTPVENGHRVGYYVCKEEIAKAWALRSDSALTESREQVLIRYMNSRGLHKDYDALMSMYHKDIRNIERGIPNYLYPKTIDFRSTLYPTYFSLSLYQCCGYIENSSILERLELWKASWIVYKQNPFLGVGLGDHKDALDAQLEAQDSPIAHKKQRGSHNQMLTFGLMAGGLIILYFVMMMVYPFVRMRNQISFVYVAFVLIILMSMVIEDTLETQTGRMMFSLLMPLILLYWPLNVKSTED
ncbi:MAG: O-antigen ligase family protein [Bacteroidales bacterium]|nr:O-antigen ligase family protein [Bacteroidales bacterium]